MDGRIIAEWERDWLDLPRRGRQSIRLYCPSGRVGELGNTTDATDRIFQLKQGTVSVGEKRQTLSHIIGLIHGTDGQCTCYAWDYGRSVLVGPFEDNANAMRYGNIGKLEGAVLGIKPD